MKAAVIRDFAQGPRYSTFELPPAPEGVVVDVLAVALSPRVRSVASGKHYTSAGVLPLVPGIDGVGKLASGQRVYFVGASDTLGTMAERTLANPRLAVPLPEQASASVIAAGMLPAISSWLAVTKRVALQPGQSVLILGATGVAGQLAVQIAKLLGAGRVIATGRDEKALAHVQKLGADQVVRLGTSQVEVDALAQAASGVDLVLDYLWGSVTSAVMPALCRLRKDESRALHWVLIGAMAGDEVALSSVLLRKRNLHILGTGQGAVSLPDMFGVAPAIVASFAAGRLEVRVREAPLAEVETWWSAPLESSERLVFVP